MIALLDRLLPLWTEPVDGRGDPEAAFDRGAHYRCPDGGGRRPRPAPPARRGPAERLTRDTAAERSPASPLRCRVTPRFTAS